MRRIRAAAAVAITCLIACSSPGSSAPTASNARNAATAGAIDLTATKAADLRTRLDLLLGEQVLIVAKESAAAAYQTDAYPGYVTLLADNRGDLADLLRQAFGNTSAAQFDVAWTNLNRDLVEYAVGLVTHKQTQADASAADLTNVVIPAISLLMSRLTQLSAAQILQPLTQQTLATRLVVDDVVGQDFPKLYTDLHAAYGQAPRLGDVLAAQIVKLFPDKFPGDGSIQAVTLRVSLNQLMQEHAYLATMATSAAFAGRSSEKATAAAALDTNATSLTTLFTDLFGGAVGGRLGHLWAVRDSDLLDYAAGAAAASQALTQVFAAQFAALARVPQALLIDQLIAAIAVIDDQRSKAFASLAADDRAAASELGPVADGLASAGSAQG